MKDTFNVVIANKVTVEETPGLKKYYTFNYSCEVIILKTFKGKHERMCMRVTNHYLWLFLYFCYMILLLAQGL